MTDEQVKELTNMILRAEAQARQQGARDALEGVREEIVELRGKIDDVLVEADGRLIPADYKSSGNAPREDKQKYYSDMSEGLLRDGKTASDYTKSIYASAVATTLIHVIGAIEIKDKK